MLLIHRTQSPHRPTVLWTLQSPTGHLDEWSYASSPLTLQLYLNVSMHVVPTRTRQIQRERRLERGQREHYLVGANMIAFLSAIPFKGPYRQQLNNVTFRRPIHTYHRQRTKPKMMLPTSDPGTALLISEYLTSNSATLQASLPVLKFLAGPCINLFNFVMIVRTILTWYPQTDLKKSPWIFIAVPTEPLLRATRKVIQPVGGVDISPIVWFALMSFVHEILVGPQGILVLLSQK